MSVLPQDKMSAHTVRSPTSYRRCSYFLLHVLRTFVFNQAASEQRHTSLRSKLCFFFRSSLRKTGPVFMVSESVCIVFLDKCQPMTFFEVIYSQQKADAAAFCAIVFAGEVVFYCYYPLHLPPYKNMHR